MTSNKYVKLEPREHVLARPGMYIGSLDEDKVNMWIYTDKMEYKEISYISGMYKIYDEIVVNALDHVVRCMNTEKPVKDIKITIDKDEGWIDIYNTGEGIEIIRHDTHDIYIPELVFGNMLTSTNYDDDVIRTIGGQNGIGAKACNIYSKEFILETVDSKRKKIYKQSFYDNMSRKSEPMIEKYTKLPYTRIRYLADMKKFGIERLNEDMFNLFRKRVYDLCALTSSTMKIYLNDEKLVYTNFEKYSDLYLGDKKDRSRCFIKSDDERWEICVSTSDDGFKQVSFVNGINTMKGGKHVDYIVNQITKKLTEVINKKRKVVVKPTHIKDNLFVIIKSVIDNPTFDSQTKETLTTPVGKFGTKLEIDDKIIEKLYKFDIVDKVVQLSQGLEDKTTKKTDGKKKSVIRGIPKLDDANWAGTSKSEECVLILTEGDSAKTMAISGLSEIGRNKYGVFPLKGKLMNVKDTNLKRINDNEEITNLKKILGLESNKIYDDVNDLRYGKIMILTDADADGSHIKGLLFNLFHSLWPSLMTKSFLTSMLTPIVKVTKGKSVKSFYNLTEYEEWKDNNNNGANWNIKYYKGLGTSTNTEAKEYFKNMRLINYEWADKDSTESIDLAFNKKRADDRKDWLYKYDKNNTLEYEENKETNIEYSEFINKELIHFSNYNLERSIPSVCDGLKKSLRKILFCCMKRKLYKEIKVSQLAGYVSEHGAYHHGEVSLHEAIIGMAQDFVGSNNINLLVPNGQFGTRIQGGKDSASPRYIHTMLNNIVSSIFHVDDLDVLEYLVDDGLQIEPTYYVPIIPMILVNGAVGIGTGFSTNVPCYNPKDLIEYCKCMINKTPVSELKPWFRNFKGTVTSDSTKGVYKKINKTKLEITELPIGYWTEDFKNHLEAYIEKYPKVIKDFERHYTEKEVKIIIQFTTSEILDDMLKYDDVKNCTKIEHELKLVSTRCVNTGNMHLYDKNNVIRKFANADEIMEEFYQVRIKLYHKRKDNILLKLDKELKYISAKVMFIQHCIDGKLMIMNQPKQNILNYLIDNKFDKNDDSYDYLIKMPLYHLTKEKLDELYQDKYSKTQLRDDIYQTSHEEMWLNDLNTLNKKIDLI